MDVSSLLPLLLVGLAGSVHCIGMCGGIVGALSIGSGAARPTGPVIAIAVVRPQGNLLRVLAYNGGRIGSYMLAGGVAGGLAGAGMLRLASLQVAGYWLANLMLVALGLYLMDAWRGLARLEAAGNGLWRHLRPLLKPLLPMDTPLKALAVGGLWGWVPCGMVYSALLTAMMQGSAIGGAAAMAAFGLGTLPTLLGMGLLGARLRQQLQRRPVRIAGGLLVLGFGLLGLLRAANGVSLGWLDALCVTPHP
ncbi:sulfite exporter TauE/SafE family protein [Janthinobacterium aquaticum]|uniref:sulfite exporter TauE/SafE family protein n=1 Tax=Janthinobacterium sp. FT58W TaxID=2654254 RepID=UPI001264E42B|nr:sulfite exporter TauE/SafE family protein [Janthinobacterium sp. FT58W]KAB8039395.1 sulfite exporter TauE/SafE family protein [Janthinobacterium sp. FT58W]